MKRSGPFVVRKCARFKGASARCMKAPTMAFICAGMAAASKPEAHACEKVMHIKRLLLEDAD